MYNQRLEVNRMPNIKSQNFNRNDCVNKEKFIRKDFGSIQIFCNQLLWVN